MLTLSFFPSYFHPLSPQNNLLYLSRCTAVLQVFPQEGRERRPPLCVYRYPTNPPTLAHGPARPHRTGLHSLFSFLEKTNPPSLVGATDEVGTLGFPFGHFPPALQGGPPAPGAPSDGRASGLDPAGSADSPPSIFNLSETHSLHVSALRFSPVRPSQGRNLQGGVPKTQRSFLLCGLEREFLQELLLVPLTDWMRPTHSTESHLLHSRSTESSVTYLLGKKISSWRPVDECLNKPLGPAASEMTHEISHHSCVSPHLRRVFSDCPFLRKMQNSVCHGHMDP